MARFKAEGLNNVIDQMKQLGELSGEASEKMLIAGAEEVKKAWKKSAKEHGLKDTGDMIESIDFPKKAKKVSDVKSIDIYPQGKDRHGVRNAEKAFILHYGKSNFEGTNWVDRADDLSADPVQTVMTEIWETELRKRGLI